MARAAALIEPCSATACSRSIKGWVTLSLRVRRDKVYCR